MKSVWYTGLSTEEERKKFKELVESSTLILDKLKEILYNISNKVEVVKTTDYDSPSWSHKQADRNGYMRALKEIIDILDVSDRETK